VWVLRSVYQVPKAVVLATLKDVIRARQLLVEGKDIIRSAIGAYEEGRGDFADYVMRERSRSLGCDQVATFDQALLKEDGFVAP
jgi:predicted nucleic-acid-binding protein